MADAAALRVVPPHANPHVLVMGLVFAAADAFGIGSNDVANSFATSVGSGSLTLRAACCIAVFTEFTGAMALGDRVSKTIKGACVACVTRACASGVRRAGARGVRGALRCAAHAPSALQGRACSAAAAARPGRTALPRLHGVA